MASYNAVGGAGGALSGAASGAAIGSVVPGIGTAVGAVAGGVIGALGGFGGDSGLDDSKSHKLAVQKATDAAYAEQEKLAIIQYNATVQFGNATVAAAKLKAAETEKLIALAAIVAFTFVGLYVAYKSV